MAWLTRVFRHRAATPDGESTAGFALSAIFVLLAATLIDFATDTPVVDDRYLGPFLRLTPATQVTSASCAAALLVLSVAPLLRRV